MSGRLGTDTRITAAGDSAIRIELLGEDLEDRWRRTHALAARVRESGLPAVLAVIPTYDAVLVEFDPLEMSGDSLAHWLAGATRGLAAGAAEPARTFEVPVVYGGEFGPDLEVVAKVVGTTSGEIIDAHLSHTHLVRCLGAPACSPMGDAPPLPRAVPRRSVPRTSVPAGSVALAGRQALVYSVRAPGGWALIGRTPAVVVDIRTERLVPYRVGDRLRFTRISADEWDDHRDAPLRRVGGEA